MPEKCPKYDLGTAAIMLAYILKANLTPEEYNLCCSFLIKLWKSMEIIG